MKLIIIGTVLVVLIITGLLVGFQYLALVVSAIIMVGLAGSRVLIIIETKKDKKSEADEMGFSWFWLLSRIILIVLTIILLISFIFRIRSGWGDFNLFPTSSKTLKNVVVGSISVVGVVWVLIFILMSRQVEKLGVVSGVALGLLRVVKYISISALVFGAGFIGWTYLLGNTQKDSLQGQGQNVTKWIGDSLIWIVLFLSGAGMLVLLSLLFWKFSDRLSSARYQRIMVITAGILVSLALLHVFIWLLWSEEYLEWTGYRELFWVLNLGIVTVLFLFLSGWRFGKVLATLVAIIVVIGAFHHFEETPTGEKWFETSPVESRSVPSPILPEEEEWAIVCIPSSGPSYTLGARNVVQIGNSLSYDIWSEKKGGGKIGWARLSSEGSPGRFQGESHRTDTGRPGQISLSLNDRGEYQGEATWLDGSEEMKVSVVLKKR